MDCTLGVVNFLKQFPDLPNDLKYTCTSGTNAEFLETITNLSLNPEYTEAIFEHFQGISAELVSRWHLTSYTVAALGRILPNFLVLRDFALKLLTPEGSKADLLASILPSSDESKQDGEEIRQSLLGIFRLLQYDNEMFGRLLRPARLQSLLQNPDLSIRYLTIRVLCLYVHASDAGIDEMVSKFIGDESICGPWESIIIDYRFLLLWEEKRARDFQNRVRSSPTILEGGARQSRFLRVLDPHDFSPSILIIGNILLPRRQDIQDQPSSPYAFVRSKTTIRNLENVAKALLEPRALLVTGTIGCGKSFLIKYLAQQTNNASTMLSLHLNDQTDAKLLTGIYTMGNYQGTFEWHPGLITKAVMDGLWIFIEDVDKAPIDVMSTLLSLLERSELTLSSRGQKIRAKNGFRIIATMRTHLDSNGDEELPTRRLLGSRNWNRVALHPYDHAELGHIIEAKYPVLKVHSSMIMSVYRRLSIETSPIHGIPSKHIQSSRHITAHELFKWCSRIVGLLRAATSRYESPTIDEAMIDSIYLDALDCFLGSIESIDYKKALSLYIAEEMHIDSKRSTYMLVHREPRFNSLITESSKIWSVGRVRFEQTLEVLPIKNSEVDSAMPFAKNRHSLRVLEQVSAATQHREPILLVGETGIGKTSAVQYLAKLTSQMLVAINMSQESESGDLLGGYKPVQLRKVIMPIEMEFERLFQITFGYGKNEQFKNLLERSVTRGRWKHVIVLWKKALELVDERLEVLGTSRTLIEDKSSIHSSKRRKILSTLDDGIWKRWREFAMKIEPLELMLSKASTEQTIFSFVEGNLVKAVRDGHWVLLDEINLASAATLECLSGLLDNTSEDMPSLLLAETGNSRRIIAHPEFRLFASMNPATDIGKRDLPSSIRSRFTEIYVSSPDQDPMSLASIARAYLQSPLSAAPSHEMLVLSITELYQSFQELATTGAILDGDGKRPHFSIRSLTRALAHANAVAPLYGLRRAIYEGISMCFLTSLNQTSEAHLHRLTTTILFDNPAKAKAEIQRNPRQPLNKANYISISLKTEATRGSSHPQVEEHWLPRGEHILEECNDYIITAYIARNLRSLIRAVFTRKYPVLIQGPTSAGKTSMIEYLARISGNKLIRVNNHEHTDIQEYLGTYVSNSNGNLVLQDGVLVKALRKGHWIVLDELNLAPSDILEALNRLLDDNREMLIPETQEVLRPHPNFMLFATQNPVGPYGGRKTLSRAFRNRFIELQFDDIPVDELKIILSRRSALPASWSALIVEVFERLSRYRQEQRLFEQHSFATLRDLFRWAFREARDLETVAKNGYMLLAEKARRPEERQIVHQTIESVLSRKDMKLSIDPSLLYMEEMCPEMELYDQHGSGIVVWTKPMRRLFTLVAAAIRNDEPVLLVGETGCGKTTVCQMIAQAMERPLHIVNVHQNTETSDLIGAQRPIRNRTVVTEQLRRTLQDLLKSLNPEEVFGDLSLEQLLQQYEDSTDIVLENIPADIRDRVSVLLRRYNSLFEWQDGSLPQAMRSGHFFLLDEISLAEDSVLERINSVLDPDRSLLLAEKGTANTQIKAKKGFQFFATMNPGGDFGKKELSPALRNRFTEIWVPPILDGKDVLEIVREKLKPSAKEHAVNIVTFAEWFTIRYRSVKFSTLSIRDILSWIQFINSQQSDEALVIFHGAALVYIDTLGANASALVAITGTSVEAERAICYSQLNKVLQTDIKIASEKFELLLTSSEATVGPFSLSRNVLSATEPNFSFNTPTVKMNTMRLFRALQLDKPILIEGSPGVGKTSIVGAVADVIGIPLTRVNLSEQTDLMDLFGTDVPEEGGNPGDFVWRDGIFLTAMKEGRWVLLDEMNLASQSVLEGLNACLDHRGEVYIPELDQNFPRHHGFRLFAAQNPHHEGGGRKGLPSSFVNRFTVIFADLLLREDLFIVCKERFPSVDLDTLHSAIDLVVELDGWTKQKPNFGAQGSPWDFNVRDVIRWLQLATENKNFLRAGSLQHSFDTLFLQRFRNLQDVEDVKRLYNEKFLTSSFQRNVDISMSSKHFQVGLGLLPRSELISRNYGRPNLDITDRTHLLESLTICIQMSWPVLLVGHSGAGKTHIITQLALFLGVELDVLCLNSDIDATDIVGTYEQSENTARVNVLLQDLKQDLREGLLKSLTGSHDTDETTSETTMRFLEALDFITSFNMSISSVEQINAFILKLASLLNDIPRRNYVDAFEKVAKLLRHESPLQFQWLDSVLVRAVEQGRWLVLDNANLCSSSVLDRLNSLLEPNGELVINENIREDGTLRSLKPHPNFRLFLTLDPAYGEVSRAMRNRSIELFVPEANNAEDGECTRQVISESSMLRFHSFLQILNAPKNGKSVDRLVHQLATNFGFVDAPMLSAFFEQLRLGLSGNTLPPNISITDSIQAVTEPSSEISHRFIQILKRLSTLSQIPIEYLVSQPFDVLQDSPLTELGNPSVGPDELKCLGRFLRLQLSLRQMEHAVRELLIHYPGNHNLTPDQQCFSGPDSTEIAVSQSKGPFPFLIQTKDYIWKWFEYLWNSHVSCSDIYCQIWPLLQFWWKLLNLMRNKTIDSSAMLQYIELGKRLLSKTQGLGDQQAKLFSICLSALTFHFSSPTRKSGFSMERVWRRFAVKLPRNKYEFDVICHMESLCERFDEFVWKPRITLHQTLPARSALVDTLRRVHDYPDSADDLLQGIFIISKEIDQKSKAPHDNHIPLFRDSFEKLCATHHLSYGNLISSTTKGLEPHLIERTISLVHLLGGRRTKSIYSRFEPGSLPSELERMLNFDGTTNRKSEQTINDFSFETSFFNSLRLLQSVPLKSINLLKVEVEVICQTLGLSIIALTQSRLFYLQRIIDSIILNTFVIHADYLTDQYLATAQSILGIKNGISPRHRGNLKALADVGFCFDLSIEHYFRKIVTRYLVSWFQVDKEDETTVGNATIQVFSGLLLLFLPDYPIDPSRLAEMERKWYNSCLQDLKEDLKATNTVDKFFQRQRESIDKKRTSVLIEQLGTGPSIQPIYRNDETQSTELWQAFANALQIIEHFQDLHNGSVTFNRVSPRLDRDITAVMNTIKNISTSYQDLQAPVIMLLHGVRIGLRLSLQGAEANVNSDIVQCITKLTPYIGNQLLMWELDEEEFQIGSNSDSVELHMHIIRCLGVLSQMKSPLRWSERFCNQLSNSFDRLLLSWKSQLEYEREKKQKLMQLYQYSSERETEDVSTAQGLTNILFLDSKSTILVESSNRESSPHNVGSLTSKIAKLHHVIFSGESEPISALQKLICDTGDLIAQLTATEHSMLPNSYFFSRKLMPIVLLKSNELYENYSLKREQDENHDVYTDRNIHEAERLTLIVYEAIDHFELIRREWPEHDIPRLIIAICQDILLSKHTEPVMRMLSRVEMLCDRLAEWQEVTNRQYSASQIYNKFADLAISWRRLELSSWARLLDNETANCAEEAQGWWFLVYQNVIEKFQTHSMGDLDDMLSDVSETLNDFITSSTVGEFGPKLKILSSICEHAKLFASRSVGMASVQRVLANIINHFERFTSFVDETISSKRHSLSKEVESVIKLASWKDRNVSALRESANASHKKLFKIVKKYRAYLCSPAHNILRQYWKSKCLEKSAIPGQHTHLELEDVRELCAGIVKQNESLWNIRPKRFQRIWPTTELVKKMSTISQNRFNPCTYIKGFLQFVDIEILNLQSKTPNKLTKENISLVSHLVTLKRKLFADILRELKIMGIQSNHGSAALDYLRTKTKILSRLPHLSNARSELAYAARGLLHQVLDIVSDIRNSRNQHHDDLSQAEVEKALGYFEGLLRFSIAGDMMISNCTSILDRLKSLLVTIRNLWSIGGCNVIRETYDNSFKVQRSRVLLDWLPSLIATAVISLESQANLARCDFSRILNRLKSWRAVVEEISNDESNKIRLPDGLISISQLATAEKLKSLLRDIRVGIDRSMDEIPITRGALSGLLDWVNDFEALGSHRRQTFGDVEKKDLVKVLNNHFGMMDTILGSIQDVNEKLQDVNKSSEDFKWMIHNEEFYLSHLASFHPFTIADSISSVLNELRELEDHKSEDLEYACASLRMSLPIIEHYVQAFEESAGRYELFHHNICRLTLQLGTSFIQVSGQGFCLPMDGAHDNGTRQSDESQAGTGLGDGRGTKDISKDIGEDEDLSELAGGNDPEDGGDDAVESKEAIRISDDIRSSAVANGGSEEFETAGKSDHDEDSSSDGSLDSEGGSEMVDGDKMFDERGSEMGESRTGINEGDGATPSRLDERTWDHADDADILNQKNKSSTSQSKNGDVVAAEESPQNQSPDSDDDTNTSQNCSDEILNSDEDEADLETELPANTDANITGVSADQSDILELPENIRLETEQDKIEEVAADSDEELVDKNHIEDQNSTDAIQNVNESVQHQETLDQDEEDIKSASSHIEENGVVGDGPFYGQDAGPQNASNARTDGASNLNEIDLPEINAHEDVFAKPASEAMRENFSSQAGTDRSQGYAQGSGNNRKQQPTHHENANTDTSYFNEEVNTIQKLGNILDEWHRRNRHLLQSQESSEEAMHNYSDIDKEKLEFEHAFGEKEEGTQALGHASEEQSRALDQSLGIIQDNEESYEILHPNLGGLEEEPNDLQKNNEGFDRLDQEHSAHEENRELVSFVGPAHEKRYPDRDILSDREDTSGYDLEDVELQLSGIKLQYPGTTGKVTDSKATELWRMNESRTNQLSLALTEQLRLILDPTLAHKLRGDFRTGKRLNLKRIIPYIASQYKRDKIWMRRNLPSKRTYQIVLAIDDSKSMGENSRWGLAFETLALLAKSLSTLEVGEIGVAAFGEDVHVAHRLDHPFDAGAGPQIIRQFGFQQGRTNISKLISESIEIFRLAKTRSKSQIQDIWQLELIISDGIFEDHERVSRLVAKALDERIMIVFVIVDDTKNGQSIVDLEKVEFIHAEGKDGIDGPSIEKKKYLEQFPFKYYIVVQNINELPNVLAAALRQWFAETVQR